MKIPGAIAIAALMAASLWLPASHAQSRGSADASGIPPQLQTDSQRQAARAQAGMQQGAMQGGQGGQWDGDAQRAEPYAVPAPYGVDGRAVAPGLGTAMAVDLINAAAGAATNSMLRSDGQPYPQYAPGREDDGRDEAGAGQAWQVEGQPPRYP